MALVVHLAVHLDLHLLAQHLALLAQTLTLLAQTLALAPARARALALVKLKLGQIEQPLAYLGQLQEQRQRQRQSRQALQVLAGKAHHDAQNSVEELKSRFRSFVFEVA